MPGSSVSLLWLGISTGALFLISLYCVSPLSSHVGPLGLSGFLSGLCFRSFFSLGLSWSLFGALLACLGLSWSLLRMSCASLGLSGALLGVSLALLGHFWLPLAGPLLASPGRLLGGSWPPLGCSWASLFGPLGPRGDKRATKCPKGGPRAA